MTISTQELTTLRPHHSTTYSALKSRKYREQDYAKVRESVKHSEGSKAVEQYGCSSGVYLLTLGTVCYVGSSTNLLNRFYQHRSNLKSDKRQHAAALLQQEYNRLLEAGLNPLDHLTFKVLEPVADHDALRPIECRWIYEAWLIYGKNLANTAGVKDARKPVQNQPEDVFDNVEEIDE